MNKLNSTICKHSVFKHKCDICTLEARIIALESNVHSNDDTKRLDFLLTNLTSISLSGPYLKVIPTHTRSALDKVMGEKA